MKNMSIFYIIIYNFIYFYIIIYNYETFFSGYIFGDKLLYLNYI